MSEQLDAELDGLYQNQSALEAEELRATREQLLRIERATLQDLLRQGLVDGNTARRLAEAIDARLLDQQPARAGRPDAPPTMRELKPTDATAPLQASIDAARVDRPPAE